MLLLFYFKGMRRLEETFSRERKAVDDLLDIAKVRGYDWCCGISSLRHCIVGRMGGGLFFGLLYIHVH